MLFVNILLTGQIIRIITHHLIATLSENGGICIFNPFDIVIDFIINQLASIIMVHFHDDVPYDYPGNEGGYDDDDDGK